MSISVTCSKKSFGRLHSSGIWWFQLGGYVPGFSRKVLRPASATDAETSASVVIVLSQWLQVLESLTPV
ncbi:MAG: hypothetical protein LBC03_05360 [Nitrososphaerota archaeon]|jgi:hypothetical protein|nr:hypothetical protein [Nitrososphaerota archaeon]